MVSLLVSITLVLISLLVSGSGGTSASYFLIEFMNSRCFLSSSSWAAFCSLA